MGWLLRLGASLKAAQKIASDMIWPGLMSWLWQEVLCSLWLTLFVLFVPFSVCLSTCLLILGLPRALVHALGPLGAETVPEGLYSPGASW